MHAYHIIHVKMVSFLEIICRQFKSSSVIMFFIDHTDEYPTWKSTKLDRFSRAKVNMNNVKNDATGIEQHH